MNGFSQYVDPWLRQHLPMIPRYSMDFDAFFKDRRPAIIRGYVDVGLFRGPEESQSTWKRFWPIIAGRNRINLVSILQKCWKRREHLGCKRCHITHSTLIEVFEKKLRPRLTTSVPLVTTKEASKSSLFLYPFRFVLLRHVRCVVSGSRIQHSKKTNFFASFV